MRRRVGQGYGMLRAMNLGDLAERLVAAPNMQEAINRALSGIKNIANTSYRREAAEMLFGSDMWATIASELDGHTKRQIEQMIAELPAGSEEAAEKFNLGLTKMQLGFDELRNHAVGPLLKDVNELLSTLNRPETYASIKEQWDGLTARAKDLGTGISSILELGKALRDGDWAKAGESLGQGAKSLGRLGLPGALGLIPDDKPQKRLRENGGATVQQQSLDGQGGGLEGLIHRAALNDPAGIGRMNRVLGPPGMGRITPYDGNGVLRGGKEMNLTGMTLDQISELGRHMRRQPGNPNSSALGRYQIVGDTMRRLMRRMGLKGDELFDEKMQDRMAAELARDTRGQPGRLANEWASLRGQRLTQAVELMRKVDPNAPAAREYAKDRPGDSMMGRAFGLGGVAAGAPKMEATGAVNITLGRQMEEAI